MKMNRAISVATCTRQSFALSLAVLLFAQPALALARVVPEVPPSLPEAPLPEAQQLQIVILDGEGALNNIRQRTAREPIVQVEDKNHKPVAGALVLFTINSGPGGAGATVNGLTNISVITDATGKATLHGLVPNTTAGNFTITVTASLGAMAATAVIHQINQGKPPASNFTHNAIHSHGILTGAVVGAVVTGQVLGLVLSHGGGGAQITPGTGTVGAP